MSSVLSSPWSPLDDLPIALVPAHPVDKTARLMAALDLPLDPDPSPRATPPATTGREPEKGTHPQ